MIDTAAGPMVGRITRTDWVPEAGLEVILSIRPEAWRVEVQSGENPVTGKITERSYLGQRIQYLVETPLGTQQVVELNPHLVRDPGETPVRLTARHADVAVLPTRVE
jgi:ABC-type Fe3+/spermidine/putrescine transport system ATPase subunit